MLIKHVFLFFILIVGLLTACSPKENTAASRRWQAFVTRYNVYYNATQAYEKGEEAQRSGLREDYTERLPVFGVGYEKMRSLGRNDFDLAITKCEKAIQLHSIKAKPKTNLNHSKTERERAYLSRKEFNPFLKNAWLLMGRAQFQQGEFVAAASTFAYITRFYAAEPMVVAEARIWLARCYAELEWFYDAEDALQRLDQASTPKLSRRLGRERDLTMADFLIRQERLDEAVPYLQRAARSASGSHRRARLSYLLGQVYMALDRKAEAYAALQQCINRSPDYAMMLHARILQTEALTTPQSAKRMITRLQKMTRNSSNKDYLDQLYYAIGNINLALSDTTAAITAYETGRAKSTQATPEKGLLLLRLGGLYWERQRFDKAQPCYTEAIGLLDRKRADYAELTRRSKVLDELVPYTSVVFEQDSLLALAQMPEADRNAVIDRAIALYKKQQEEARRNRADSLRQAQEDNNDNGDNDFDRRPRGNEMPQPPLAGNNDKSWYFYNPQLVQQGKQSFTRQWGRRKNEDDWRRANRSLLASSTPTETKEEAPISAPQKARRDSLSAQGLSPEEIDRRLAEDTEKPASDKPTEATTPTGPAADPLQREFYLAKVPFTAEQQKEAHQLIRDALIEAGIIEKDKLGDYALAESTFDRLIRNYPDFERLNEAYYHLFLLAKRKGDTAAADRYRQTLATHYPDYALTPVVNDPDFDRNSRYARELEDSLYASTYNAYRLGDAATVTANFARSTATYPQGANRPKFILVHALSRLGTAPRDTIAAELRTLATEHPKSDVAEMAAMIVRGIEMGRNLSPTSFDLGGLWSRRLSENSAATAAAGEDRQLSEAKDVPFVFLIAYPTDSLSDDSLLYALARFNFSAFVTRGFDIGKERNSTLTQFRVSGFTSYDDVHYYAQRLFRDPALARLLRRARIELISETNLRLLGTLYSFDDYRKFFDKHFAPLRINPNLPLEYEPPTDDHPKQIYEDEVTQPAGHSSGTPQTSTDTDTPASTQTYDEYDE